MEADIPGVYQMNEEWNKMRLNEMGENKADRSALNKDDTNFVEVDWANSMIPYMKHIEQRLEYSRHLILTSAFSPLSLVYSESSKTLWLPPF